MALEQIILERDLQVVNELDEEVALTASTYLGARASHVFLLTQDNHLLLQKTGPDHRNPGRIGSSVAGFVIRGETYAEAARRRTEQELGITPVLRRIGSVRSPEPDGFKFSAVFIGSGDSARVALPGHVGSLVRLGLDEISSMLVTDSSQFTPTFPYVFALISLYFKLPQ